MSFEHTVSHRKYAKILVAICFVGMFTIWSLDRTSQCWRPKVPEISISWTPPTATFDEPKQITLSSDQTTVKKDLLNWLDDRNEQQQLEMKTVFAKTFSSSVGNNDIRPFYHKAKHTAPANDITIMTTITKSRIHTLAILAERYQGPISAAFHLPSDDTSGSESLALLAETIEQQPAMQKYVDIHLIVDKMDRQLNLWRNVARFFARTDNVMMLDVDFYLCTDFRKHILENAQAMELLNNGHSALVIPAFEFTKQDDGLDYHTFPTNKADLMTLYQQEDIDMFHAFWTPGHAPTNYPKWFDSSNQAIYKVTDYQQSYEPYIIYKKDNNPWCDERFVGYGSNKAVCLFELFISGVDFYVMPQDFIIHQTHDYPNETRSLERMYNRRLYNQFREEVCIRYARMFITLGQWETSVSANLIEQCSKIPSFYSMINSFL